MNSFIDNIWEFIQNYYIDPIIFDTGYNPVNTITWAIFLGIFLFGVIKLFKRLNISVDDRFILSIIPFILAGSSLRVVEDAGIFNAPVNYLLITPIIYFLVFAIVILTLVVSKWLYNKEFIKDYHILVASIGSLWFIFNVSILLYFENVVNLYVPYFVIGAATLLVFIVYKILKYSGLDILSTNLNFAIMWAHLLDASSTIVGIDLLGYHEKHVVPSYLIELTNTATVMYPLKILIFIPVLYILDSYFNEDRESRNLKTFVKIVILILGLAPACRNTIRMTLGI
ncbi:Protein of unknown function DUF63 [Methanohalobium evestigatum Z-7303]|uniref:DUF63 family protein n=1 Tax=Methanohalobium evestigatum (strain ATCC BAA-1072 / DSM 3721 / NBRC 107634 / OCM 161 / Z-7303) TaxID=644295 RepID=D7E8D2_METEZ|nr:DUF63 family protein [Methanohalobium evestigatum]ADI73474.1 Protein of unknown function DUF63 [Methanohalobium evestigatum Z-7303]